MSMLLAMIRVGEMDLLVHCTSAQASAELAELAKQEPIELWQYGAWVEKHYGKGFMVGSRPITNIEMSALNAWQLHQAEERASEHGCCCDEGPDTEGRCRHGLGTCRIALVAERLAFKLWRISA